MSRKVAFVTGASRGIGKACAIHLARAGFDVAISARTVEEGEAREHSSTLKASNTKPLPGSLRSTAIEIENAGVQALLLAADLLDYASLGAAATKVLERWGRVDVVVQNGRYIGPGHMDLLLETPIELIETQLRANVVAPLILSQYFLPGMRERGEGAFIGITSAAGYGNPPAPAGRGGWGMGQPGLIQTERLTADMADFGFSGGAPPEVIGAVCAWIATHPEERCRYNGDTIEGQYFCQEKGLLPGWAGPMPGRDEAMRYDLAGARLDDYEAKRRKELGIR